MPVSCIICHMEIVEGIDSLEECPNGHPVHEECLKKWLCHSLKCPLCNDSYSSNLIAKYEDYLESREKEKQEVLNSQLQKEMNKRIEEIAEKMVFLKFTESIENLIEKEKFDAALERLDAVFDENTINFKNQKILFLKGKINFIRGRFDLAINYLFKLVKQKFDFPDAFLYLGKSYEKLGLTDKAKWAYDRVK